MKTHILFVRMPLMLMFQLVLTAGCRPPPVASNRIPVQAEEALRESPQFTLFSIDPSLSTAPESSDNQLFHRYRIIGEITLADRERRERVLRTLQHDVSQWSGNYEMCFWPRHGVRVKGDATVYDFLICYECERIEIYAGDKLVATVGITGSQKLFDEMLTAANVPLPEPPKH